MDPVKFLEAVKRIVGDDNALRYQRRFGPLDQIMSNSTYNYEALAAYVYSTELNWHQRINSELWSGAPSPEVRLFSEVLNQLLAKLPPYLLNDRVVYRGYKANDLDQFLLPYEVGSRVRFPAFTSATFREELAFGGNVFFTIRTHTGRAIWYLAANFDELEVLIPSGRAFSVVHVERRRDKAFISLDELSDANEFRRE